MYWRARLPGVPGQRITDRLTGFEIPPADEAVIAGRQRYAGHRD